MNSLAALPVSLEDVTAAAARIREHTLRTPLLRQLLLEKGLDCTLYLKPENLQRVGAFKFRGAYNTLKLLQESGNPSRVITSSSGNHGQAVAAAGQILGIDVTVVMPENAVQVKVDAVKSYGGDIVFAGKTSGEREAKAREIGDQTGGTVIGSFDDGRIIAGQGTIGLEILEDLPEVDVVVVPIGGGGLIGGIATAIKSQNPDIRIVGVEPEGASDAYQSFTAGHRVSLDHIETLADGLRTSSPGVLNFEIIRQLVDEIVLVTEDEIRDTMRRLAMESKLVVEPSGAVSLAAVLSGQIDLTAKNVVAVVSGGNVDPTLFAEIIRG